MAKTQIIAITNHKGGVGKTTTAANIGSMLAKKGVKTLLVDLDAQMNLSDTFLPEIQGKTIYDCFVEEKAYDPKEVNENLWIMPSDMDMAALDFALSATISKEQILKGILYALIQKYGFEVVLLDCPPSFGIASINAIAAATRIYVPVTPEFYPFKGLVKIEEMCSKIERKLNPGISVSRIIITRTNSGKTLNNTVITKLREVYGEKVFNTLIRENVKLAESPIQHEDIATYAPLSNGAKDYGDLTKEILKDLKIFPTVEV